MDGITQVSNTDRRLLCKEECTDSLLDLEENLSMSVRVKLEIARQIFTFP